MAKSVLFLANYYDVLTINKFKTNLTKLCGFDVTEKKLKRYTWNGLTFSDEYLSLKLNILFPERIILKPFCKENGTLKALDLKLKIEL